MKILQFKKKNWFDIVVWSNVMYFLIFKQSIYDACYWFRKSATYPMGNEISSFIKYLQHKNKYSESKAHAVNVLQVCTYKDEL